MKQSTKNLLRVLISLMLVVVTLLSVSCGGKGGNTTTTTAGGNAGGNTPGGNGGNGGTSVYNPLDDVEIRTIDRDMTILGYVSGSGWVTENVDYESEVAGDPLKEEEFKRSQAFEEKYTVTLKYRGSTIQQCYDDLQGMQMMSSTDYDYITPHPTEMLTSMMTAGFFRDLNTVETMHMEKDWYNQGQIQEYVTNGKLYLAASDTTITGQAFFCLVYNRDALAKLQLDTDIKTLVEKGEWTVQALNEILTLTEFSGDNADGSQIVGLGFNSAATQRWLWALGGRVLTKDTDGNFISAMTADKTAQEKIVAIANGLDSIINDHGATVTVEHFYNAGLPDSQLYKNFQAGKTVFVTFDMGSQFNYMREVSFDKSYAPLPKLTTSQPDYYVACASGMHAIPAYTTSFEESGLMFEFFSRYSNVNLKRVFFETILGGRLSEFPEDYEMLNFLHSKKCYDVGYTLDQEGLFLNSLEKKVITDKAPDGISIYLAGLKKKMTAILEIANGIK